jgi:hypothetical protein
MNREDIIRMAREAGLHKHQHNLMSNPVQHRFSYDGYEENLERFAALIAFAEREACAKVCDEASKAAKNVDPQGFVWKAVKECAYAIRARGQA